MCGIDKVKALELGLKKMEREGYICFAVGVGFLYSAGEDVLRCAINKYFDADQYEKDRLVDDILGKNIKDYDESYLLNKLLRSDFYKEEFPEFYEWIIKYGKWYNPEYKWGNAWTYGRVNEDAIAFVHRTKKKAVLKEFIIRFKEKYNGERKDN